MVRSKLDPGKKVKIQTGNRLRIRLTEMTLFHVTMFLECPFVGKGGREEAKKRRSAHLKHVKSWSRLACSRLRYLCLSSLMGIPCSLIIPVRFPGRLPACQHLHIVTVRIGGKDNTVMRNGARFQRRRPQQQVK